MATKKKSLVPAFPPPEKEVNRPPNLFVCTPMYGGMATGYYVQSLIQMPSVLQQHGISMGYSAMFNESLIQRGRNSLVHTFLPKKEFTHLMFIDADIRFNAADVVKMIKEDKDIIAGIYPKKQINWQGVKAAVDRGEPVEDWKKRTGDLVINLKDYAGTVTVPADKPVEVNNTGTGFMLIKRETFEKMEPFVRKYKNDVTFIDQGIRGQEEIIEYFACDIEPGTERLLSEDYYFCWRAREAGLRVWAAPWAELGHFGTYLFEGGLLPAP